MSNGVQCDNCGFIFEGHSNNFGKICTRCGNYIKSINPIEKIYQDKYKQAQETIISYLKQNLREKYANKREQEES